VGEVVVRGPWSWFGEVSWVRGERGGTDLLVVLDAEI
jgi:hypothetical protein